MSHEHEQLSIQRETPAIWRVTFRHPPINLVDHGTLQELHDLTSAIETSDELKVVVFDSADPDFFLAHWDLASVAPARRVDAPAPSWLDISLRLARAPVITIALIPGGGSMERLALLAGRARALEIVLSAADVDAATAERYGWINRALPDAELDSFVANLVQRVASFDKVALAAAKQAINRHTLP